MKTLLITGAPAPCKLRQCRERRMKTIRNGE